MINLSILDQSPIASNQSAKDALHTTVKLAQLADTLGYTRYWVAEHHDLPGLACSAPEVMLGILGTTTKQIRIGAGAVLLPHYKPYKVAETYNLLATLFPDRVDVGIGRSPGGSAEATNALNDNFLQKVFNMPNLVEELLHFFHQDFPSDHQFSKVKASPVPETLPTPWMLGTSEKSAILAAKYGLAYAFGQFMSNENGAKIINSYKSSFQSNQHSDTPQVLMTVPVICAETTEKAEEIALSSLIWQIQTDKGEGNTIPSIEEAKAYELKEKEQNKLLKMKEKMVIGNPKEVSMKLKQIQKDFQVDEIMLLTITHSIEDRANTYKLLAKELLENP